MWDPRENGDTDRHRQNEERGQINGQRENHNGEIEMGRSQIKKDRKTVCMVQTKRGKLTIILDPHCQHCLESSPTLSLESRLETRLRL